MTVGILGHDRQHGKHKNT